MPYWELYYHLVWATKQREPLITPEMRDPLYNYLRGKGMSLGGIVHSVGGIDDHVHVAVSIPPRLALSDFVGQLKGASAHWVTHVSGFTMQFGWQADYGALSFGKQALPLVVEYIHAQPEHHRDGRLFAAMERTEEARPDHT
jgi:REP element-mobilizing transposase RayT